MRIIEGIEGFHLSVRKLSRIGISIKLLNPKNYDCETKQISEERIAAIRKTLTEGRSLYLLRAKFYNDPEWRDE